MFTRSQLETIQYCQKGAGAISMVCSAYLILNVLTDSKKRCKVYHRMIVGVSVFDAVVSFMAVISTWPIPKDSGIIWAAGNDATCNAQGFFVQFVLGSAIYNTCLSVYYLLVIKYGWKENQIRKIEPLLHAAPILLTLGTATFALFKDLYRNSFFWCWIRGDMDEYRWGLFYAPLWALILTITGICVVVWLHVRQVEKNIYKYTASGHSRAFSSRDLGNDAAENKRAKKIKHSNQTKIVGQQCFLYASAFYVNWISATVNRILGATTGETYYSILVLTAILTPILGLPNFLVYLLPKFRQVKKDNSQSSLFQWIKLTLLQNKEDAALDAAAMIHDREPTSSTNTTNTLESITGEGV